MMRQDVFTKLVDDYIAREEDFGGGNKTTPPVFLEQGTLASVAWTAARHAYVMVTSGAASSLHNIS